MPPRRKPTSTTNSFTEALKFISLITKDAGTINETHVHIQDHKITAFNGILAAGCRVDNELTACPQIKLAIEALSKCGQNIAITQLDNNRLSIRSEKFKAIVPCIATELLSATIPDPPVADIDDRLKQAFEVAGLLKDENGQMIYNVSVLMNGQSIVSSLSGSMIIEYWHGLNLPDRLSIPKTLIGPLSKINKKLIKFGYSPSSITLYFEDDSWLRSQLYAENWPDVAHVFDCKPNLWPFPADFWTGLAAIAPFSDGLCHFHAGCLSSHSDLAAGASFEIPNLPSGPIFPIKQLMALQPWASHVDWQVQGPNGAMLLAQGKAARAIIAGCKHG